MITTSVCSDVTDGTTGTSNGSPTPYVPSLPSSAVKIPSLIGTLVTGTLEWLTFRTELESTFDTLTYTSLTAKD